jgi:hypothetical protein
MKSKWDLLQVPAIWVLGSLMAIAVIGDAPYLGLAIAILAGIALGLATHLAHGQPDSDNSPSRTSYTQSGEGKT